MAQYSVNLSHYQKTIPTLTSGLKVVLENWGCSGREAVEEFRSPDRGPPVDLSKTDYLGRNSFKVGAPWWRDSFQDPERWQFWVSKVTGSPKKSWTVLPGRWLLQPQTDWWWMDDRWMHGWTDGWMDAWMDGWMDAWMVGWMDAWMCTDVLPFSWNSISFRHHPNLQVASMFSLLWGCGKPVSLVTAHHIRSDGICSTPHQTVLEVHFHLALKNRSSYLHQKVLF